MMVETMQIHDGGRAQRRVISLFKHRAALKLASGGSRGRHIGGRHDD
jgi:hypothetical protein